MNKVTEMSKKINGEIRQNIEAFVPNNGNSESKIMMKGNVGIPKKVHVKKQFTEDSELQFSGNGNQIMADEFDIDNVIPKNLQMKKAVDPKELSSSGRSYDLSHDSKYFMQDGISISQSQQSRDTFDHINGRLTGGNGAFSRRENPNFPLEDDSKLISSDSDFENAPPEASGQKFQSQMSIKNQNSGTKTGDVQFLRKEISKTFKRMLTISSQNKNKITSKNGISYEVPGAKDKYGNSINNST